MKWLSEDFECFDLNVKYFVLVQDDISKVGSVREGKAVLSHGKSDMCKIVQK